MKTIVYMPNSLAVKVDLPQGIEETDSEFSRQIFELSKESIFASLPEDERKDLFASLHRTYERCQYHYFRFNEIKSFLESNRKSLPEEIFYDSSLKYLYFEIQSLFGSIRLFLDEMFYVIARKYGLTHESAFSGDWKVSNIFQHQQPKANSHLPEINLAKNFVDWYKSLNNYRNAFYHHGWNYSSGHADPNSKSSLANKVKFNGFYMPDVNSVTRESKSFQWTWNQKTHVFDVVQHVKIGFEDLVSQMIFSTWGVTPTDYSGAIPVMDQPNIIISLPLPCLILYDCDIVIPVFTTLEKAEEFKRFSEESQTDGVSVEILEVTKNKFVGDEGYFSFSFFDIENVTFPEKSVNSKLKLALDPVFDIDGKFIRVKLIDDLTTLEEIKEKSIQPISFHIPDQEKIYVWRKIIHS